MKKKFFIVSDVHGFYDEMIVSLQNNGFDKNNNDHIFVSLGDLCDRGTQNKKCLEYVNSLERKILILGNHEDLMNDAINRKRFYDHDYHNRTVETVEELTGIPYFFNYGCFCLEQMKKNKLWNQYIKQCVDFYEIGDYIFVHGWIPCREISEAEGQRKYCQLSLNWRKGNWKNARWYNGFDAWSSGIKLEGKTIVCGHWSTSYAHETYHQKKNCNDIFYDDGIIGLDATTVLSNQVNCLVLEINK